MFNPSRSRCFQRGYPGSYGSPYAQPNALSGASPSQHANKVYVVSVPVYASPAGSDGTAEAQAEWNKVTHKFSVASGGQTKTYEVAHNMANPSEAAAKVYPDTGVTVDGTSYFPTNTWGFAISPRNLKQYNFEMLIDSLSWNNYEPNGVYIKWVPRMGANQTGSFEAVLIPNGLTMPSAPYTNQTNAVNLTATQTGEKFFEINKQISPVKNMRSTQSEFDMVADFGILWFRTSGYTGLSGITQVGEVVIKLDVALSNYLPSPYAQLVGPWIEAGYPIQGSQQTQDTSNPAITGSMMLAVDTKVHVALSALKRGKARKPRWYIVPKVSDTHVVGLGAMAQVGSALQHAKAARRQFRLADASDKEIEFPMVASGSYDMALTGKTFLTDAADPSAEDAHQVVAPEFPYVEVPDLYLKDAKVTVTPAEANPALQLAFKPSGGAINTQGLAQGGITVDYTASTATAGLGAAATLRWVTSFAAGSVPPTAAEGSVVQPVFGYDPSIGIVGDAEPPDGSDGFFAKVCGLAGSWLDSKIGAPQGDDLTWSVQDLKDTTVNAFQSVGNSIAQGITKVGHWFSSRNDDILVQASNFVVPANATYRSKIAAYTDTIRAYTAKKFLSQFEAAQKFGLDEFIPEKLTQEQSRLTVTGQINSLHQALMAIGSVNSSAAPTEINQLPVSTEVADLMVLVASRVDPVEDPTKFINTAVPITPLLDGLNRKTSTKSLYVQRLEDPSKDAQFVVQSIATGNGVKEVTNTPLAGVGLSQLATSAACNFTIPWPDRLVDPDSGALTELKPGEHVYLSFIKSTAVTYSHTINEGSGSYKLFVFPNVAPGTDKAAADQALHSYSLNKTGNFSFDAITDNGAVTESVHMVADGERRFSVQDTTPVPAAQSRKLTSSIRLV